MYNIKVGNLYYFLSLIVFALLFTAVYFALKNKSKQTQQKVLLIWAFVNFALHFLKQLYYLRTEYLYLSTLNNICAVSTVVLPFIILIKRDCFLKDTVLFLSILGGVAGLIYPTEIINSRMSLLSDFMKEVEAVRFYFCHFSLASISILLGVFNIQKMRLKVFYLIPIGILVYLFIIFLNTALICFTNMVSYPYISSQVELFWDNNLVNNSFVFGPTDDMGIISKILDMLCPNFMKVDYLNISQGYMKYWPVVWLIVPAYIVFMPLYLLVALLFNIKQLKTIKLDGILNIVK